MATCEKREIVQPKPPVEYVLTLSEEEARVLARFIEHYAIPLAAAMMPSLGSGQWPHEDEAPFILNAIFGRMKFAGVLR